MDNNDTHPWNFGIKPSEYIRGLTASVDPIFGESYRELGERIISEVGGLERLDELFLHTLECPPLRTLTPEQKEELLRGAEPFDVYDATKTLILVVSHAKPAGNFRTCIPQVEEKKLGDVLSKFGISFRYYPNRGKYNPYVEIGFDDDVCRVGIENWERWWKREVSDMAHEIVVGIIFGYPLADAFGRGCYPADGVGYVPKRNCKSDLSELLHTPYPSSWSRQWAEQVGWEGEERLARIYRAVLGNLS